MENKRQAGLELVMRLHVTLEQAVFVRDTPKGKLNIIPITGGTAEGPGFCGKVCYGGADWNTVLPCGLNHVFAKYWLMDDQGNAVSVENEGMIDWQNKTGPFITTPRFSCDVNGPYAALNSGVYTGELAPGGENAVNITFWRVGE